MSEVQDELRALPTKKHIPKLDALRALSALAVMLYHFGYPLPAGLGVTCFFVLSGFLITWLLLAEHEKTGTISLSSFYVRRSFRIFPAFYGYWFAIIGFWLLRHKVILWSQAIAAFFYVGNYYQGLNHYPSTPFARTWSLGVEEQFYLLWPLLFGWLAHDRRRLLKVLVGLIAAVWALRMVLFIRGVDEAYLYTAFECRADALFAGCALSIILRERMFERAIGVLCGSWLKLIPTVLILAVSVTLEFREGTNYRDTVGHALVPLLFAVLILQLLLVRPSWLDVLDARPIRFLGTLSYSTYLYHGAIPVPAGFPLFLKVVPSYVLAAISYYGIERPCLRLRDRFMAKWRPEAA